MSWPLANVKLPFHVPLPKCQKDVLFWTVCIPLRYYLSTLGDNRYLRAYALITSINWLSGMENSEVGQFGGPAWWKEERSLHGALWGAYAITGNSAMLKADVALGAVNWVVNNT